MSTPSAGQSAGQLETRGIEPVPEGECNGHPLQLFWVWFAANISILGLPLGATLVAFRGLAIWQAIIVAILGAAGSFAVVGIISIAGRRGRAPSLTLSRAIFGVRGNIGPTLVSLMSRLGWETVNTTTAAFVLLSLCSILFGSAVEAKSAPVLTLIFIGIFVLLTLAVSGLGHATLLVIQKWATYVFGALNILVGGFLCATIDWSAVFNATPAPMSAMIIGIGTMGHAAYRGLAIAREFRARGKTVVMGGYMASYDRLEGFTDALVSATRRVQIRVTDGRYAHLLRRCIEEPDAGDQRLDRAGGVL